MANELGNVDARIVKALLDEGWKGQDIAILFGVNSRAVSQIKSGEEYPTVKPDYNHGIPAEIFGISKIEILNTLGREAIKKIFKVCRGRGSPSY